jgi:hypothetical protein
MEGASFSHLELSFLARTPTWAIASAVFFGMVLSVWVGRRIGRRLHKGPEEKKTDHGLGVGSLTGLLFFMLAFTFGMSGSRYDTRMRVVVDEANCIGTALLRADLYPDSIRELFRKDFHQYIEVRIAYFETGINPVDMLRLDSLSNAISGRLWQRATTLGKDPKFTLQTLQMCPALNAMIDVVTSRFAGEKARVPESIVWMLFFLAFTASFFAGYSVPDSRFDWLIAIGSCLLISFVIYITIDLDRPRRGFHNMRTANDAIISLRNSFYQHETAEPPK